MRYIIVPNSEPPGRVSLRLHIAAGSLMEAEDQRGLAHFLEHMVFNGTKNYSAADLIPRMQRLGIAFGAHANAYTSFDETVYMLDLPDLTDDTLDLAFTVMRDFGDGALLSAEEIDKERGVILSEKISRDSVGYRLMEQQFRELLPDSLVTKRFPIGDEEVIKNAPRERFVDFYTRYYTPRRMTFIVSGDVKTDEIKQRIEAAFASMSQPAKPGEDPDMGMIKPVEGLEASVFHDKEVGATEVSLNLIRPWKPLPDTKRTRADKLPLALAHAMISRRFERLSKQQNSPIASGSANRSDLFNQAEIGSIDITAAGDRWQEVVPIIEQELRRAIEHGFGEAELAEETANLLNQAEQAVKQKPTRKSEGLATGIARSINENSVFSAPETDLALIKEAVATISPESCHKALTTFWEASGFHLTLTTKSKTEGMEQQLAALFEESRGVPVEPPAARETIPFAYETFGQPGTVKSSFETADLGIRHLVLSNGVRVNLKQTDFEKGRIRLSARFGNGQLSQPKDSPMLDTFASAIMEGGGLGKHSAEELQQILAGKNVSASFSISEDAFSLSGSTTPADLALQLRLMCAALTDPGWRNEALWQFQKAIPMLEQQLKHTPAGPQKAMDAWLHGGDARFSIATSAQLGAYTIEDARRWLKPELTSSYLELSIVGDFEPATLEAALLETFGALPKRADQAPGFLAARKVAFPSAPAEQTFTYESKVPQAVAVALWKTSGIRGNIREFRRLNLLASILGDRLREEIRENLGASYSPDAGADGSEALDDFGFLVTNSIGKPEDMAKLLETMLQLADELALKGASADELDRALKPTLGMLDKTLRDNSYWLGTVMSRSQQEPERLELARTRDADYRSITLKEVNGLAAKYLPKSNALKVTIKPKE
jgi:zinc protease